VNHLFGAHTFQPSNTLKLSRFDVSSEVAFVRIGNSAVYESRRKLLYKLLKGSECKPENLERDKMNQKECVRLT
jgi:hypothetical protein